MCTEEFISFLYTYEKTRSTLLQNVIIYCNHFDYTHIFCMEDYFLVNGTIIVVFVEPSFTMKNS